MKDLKKNRKQPIFLNSQTGKFISTQDGKIILKDGETIDLFCPDRFKAPYDHQNVISIRCKDGKLKIDEDDTNLGCFSCKTKVESIIQPTNIDCTDSGGILHKSGFNTHLGFIELMTHCHDPNTKVNHWVDYFVTPENNICQGSIKDEFFPANYIEGILLTSDIKFNECIVKARFIVGQNIKQLYTNQRQTIAKILQSDELADKIISKKRQFILDEGHLGMVLQLIIVRFR